MQCVLPSIRKQLHPVWDEEFSFVVTESSGQVLKISLMSKDFASDTKLGEIKVPLADLQFKTVHDEWFNFEFTPGKLHLEIEYVYSYSKVQSLCFKCNDLVYKHTARSQENNTTLSFESQAGRED
jgi:Ca2+-dependent lipid-binding protein